MHIPVHHPNSRCFPSIHGCYSIRADSLFAREGFARSRRVASLSAEQRTPCGSASGAPVRVGGLSHSAGPAATRLGRRGPIVSVEAPVTCGVPSDGLAAVAPARVAARMETGRAKLSYFFVYIRAAANASLEEPMGACLPDAAGWAGRHCGGLCKDI